METSTMGSLVPSGLYPTHGLCRRVSGRNVPLLLREQWGSKDIGYGGVRKKYDGQREMGVRELNRVCVVNKCLTQVWKTMLMRRMLKNLRGGDSQKVFGGQKQI